jgi:hypothetical protein
MFEESTAYEAPHQPACVSHSKPLSSDSAIQMLSHDWVVLDVEFGTCLPGRHRTRATVSTGSLTASQSAGCSHVTSMRSKMHVIEAYRRFIKVFLIS